MENTPYMNIKDKVTIVIPCYNEQSYITKTIMSIVKQDNIYGTRVIIADGFSTDRTREKINALKNTYGDIIKIEMVNGGKVAYARNFGSSLVTTKYVLFIDADTILIKNDTIDSTLKEMYRSHLDLLTCKVKSVGTDIRTNISFRIFNVINYFVSKKTPFAVGTYFLTTVSEFRRLNGFDESLQHSEDFALSKQYSPSKFKISEKFIGQDDRRFKKVGYLYMVKLLIKSFINRNNTDFFKKDIGYW